MYVIKQESKTDCAIACCAMISNRQYSAVKKNLFALKKWQAKRKNLRTKTTDLLNLLNKLGVTARKERFKSWNSLNSPAIVGVNEEHGNKFHWVVAVPCGNKIIIADPEYGEVYDLNNCKKNDYRPRKNKDIVICNLSINEFTIRP